jgi:hypothetical protein
MEARQIRKNETSRVNNSQKIRVPAKPKFDWQVILISNCILLTYTLTFLNTRVKIRILD